MSMCIWFSLTFVIFHFRANAAIHWQYDKAQVGHLVHDCWRTANSMLNNRRRGYERRVCVRPEVGRYIHVSSSVFWLPWDSRSPRSGFRVPLDMGVSSSGVSPWMWRVVLRDRDVEGSRVVVRIGGKAVNKSETQNDKTSTTVSVFSSLRSSHNCWSIYAALCNICVFTFPYPLAVQPSLTENWIWAFNVCNTFSM